MRNKTVEAPFAAEGLKMFRKSKTDKLGVVSCIYSRHPRRVPERQQE